LKVTHKVTQRWTVGHNACITPWVINAWSENGRLL
jgi:hypothetical protein